MMIRTLLRKGRFSSTSTSLPRLAADSQTIADLIGYGLKTAAQGAGFEPTSDEKFSENRIRHCWDIRHRVRSLERGPSLSG